MSEEKSEKPSSVFIPIDWSKTPTYTKGLDYYVKALFGNEEKTEDADFEVIEPKELPPPKEDI